jgi:hypothetical protein
MTLPFAVPDWLPWWVPTVLLVLGLLWLLAFLLVPFSVIGLKTRIDGLEARLDEIQAEIRRLTLRLPDPVRPVEFDELYAAPPPERSRRAPNLTRPPIPPAAYELEDVPDSESAPPDSPLIAGLRPQRKEGRSAREERTEPRLGRPQ